MIWHSCVCCLSLLSPSPMCVCMCGIFRVFFFFSALTKRLRTFLHGFVALFSSTTKCKCKSKYFCSLKFNLLEAIVSIPKTIRVLESFYRSSLRSLLLYLPHCAPTWLILRFPFYVNFNFKVGSCVQIFYLLEKVFAVTPNVHWECTMCTTSLPSFSHILSFSASPSSSSSSSSWNMS